VCIKYGKWHGRHEKCSFLRKKIIASLKPPLQFQETEFKFFLKFLRPSKVSQSRSKIYLLLL
jgi:hypothetical protein